jgi:hypothetical protein
MLRRLPRNRLSQPAGAWADRLPARPLMVSCDVVSALLYSSLPATAWIGMLTIGQVVIVALLAGGSNVLFATAYQVYLPSLVTARELIEGNAKLQGSASVAAIGGRSTAGLAAQALGAATALLFNAASFRVSAGCLLRISTGVTPPGVTPPEPATRTTAVRTTTVRTTTVRTTTVRGEISDGVRFVLRDPYLRPLSSYAAVANLAYTGSAALIVVFLVRAVGLGPGAVGLLRPVTGTGLRAAFSVVGALVVVAGIAVGNIVTGSFRQAYCPPGMLGRVTASMRFLVFGTIPLGALIAGGLGTALGVRTALWVTLTGYALSGTLLLTRDLRAHKDLPVR